MISESTIYHMTLTCDAIPPAGLHCDIEQEFAVAFMGNADEAKNLANRRAQELGWQLVSNQRIKYPEGRHLCPACVRRLPKIKWAKR